MTTNSQLSITEPKKQKQTKQTTRIGSDSQKQRSHGGLSAGRGENGGKDTGNKKHKQQIQYRQGEVKNSLGNVEAEELKCMTHGHELQGGNVGGRGVQGGVE